MKRIFAHALCLIFTLLAFTPARAGTATGEEFVVFIYNGLILGQDPNGSWPPDGQDSIPGYTYVGSVTADEIRKGITVSWGIGASGPFSRAATPGNPGYPTYFIDMGAGVVSQEDWSRQSGWSWNHNLYESGVPDKGAFEYSSWGPGMIASVKLQMDVEECKNECDDQCDTTAADVSNQCVSVSIPLGGLGPNTQRNAAGNLFIYEETPTPTLGSPASLQYTFTGSSVVTSYSGGAINSVVTPEVTASVTILSASSYEIEITPNGSGTTLPDRVIRVERQDTNGKTSSSPTPRPTTPSFPPPSPGINGMACATAGI